MNNKFPNLFSPLKLRHKTLKHRLNFGAHTANLSDNGLPGERHRCYYEARARGGAAMIVVEPMPVHKTAVLTRGNFRQRDEAVIPGFKAIVDSCHQHGAVVIHQLYHTGAHADVENSHAPLWSPSGHPSLHDGNSTRAMIATEVEQLIEGFIYEARRAQRCGFDGVEIFAAYDALIHQFWSPVTNYRDDYWGGDFDRRMQFAHNILSGIRQAVGEDFIIGLAITGDDGRKDGLNNDSMCDIVEWYDKRQLMDYVTVGTGSYYDPSSIMPTFIYGDMLGPPLAKAIKQRVKNTLVQAESRIKTPIRAEQAIASGAADMTSLVRAQIADPNLARKTIEDRMDEIRPCISCNQLCWGRRQQDLWLSCLVNPSAGQEFEWGPLETKPAQHKKNLLVIGGGPAGMEAARVAAQRGHQVTLIEKSSVLGGQFRLAASQPKRGEIGHLIYWFYQRELARLEVDVQLDTEYTLEDIQSFNADEVILATGSRPAMTGYQREMPEMSSLPGVDADNVFSINDILSDSDSTIDQLGSRLNILLLDDLRGWWPASGTALYLAERNHNVTVVTPADAIGLELIDSDADRNLRAMYHERSIECKTSTFLTSWNKDSATLRSKLDHSEQTVTFDALVLATINKPVNKLELQLSKTGIKVHTIGDCVAARRASMAFYEGRALGQQI